MGTKLLYEDGLVTITESSVTFHRYYLNYSPRTVPFSAIKSITVREPTLLNGKWRIFGSGDLKTWFPEDWDRPRRD